MDKFEEDVAHLWQKLLHSKHKSESILNEITDQNLKDFVKFIISSNSIIIEDYNNSFNNDNNITDNES